MKITLLLVTILYAINVNAQFLEDVWELDELNVLGETEAYPYLTNDGLRLYFTNDEGGTNNLYISSRTDLSADFEPKQIVDTVFSGLTGCWLTVDELDAYYTSGASLFHSSRTTTSSAFSIGTEISLVGGAINPFLGGVSLVPGGAELYVYNTSDLVKYTYTNDTSYTFASNVTLPLAGFDAAIAQLSKDGLELYWTLAPIGADSNYMFKLDRPSLSDDFTNPVKVNDLINASAAYNSQGSYASAANVLVWVRNDNGLWYGNDLFIAQGGSASVTELTSGPKELLKIVDLLGRETKFKPNTALIYMYTDGSIEKIYVID